jgi:outer membrane protein assembly factor BamB
VNENVQKDAQARPDPAAAEKARRLRSLAVSLLLTTALFSGVVMGVMLVTRLSEPAVPPDSPALQSLRAALAQDSENEGLKEAIREEDQQARQSFFAHRRRLATGAYLLLAGLAATVICARWYASLERKTPRPTPPAEREDADRWLARRRRNLIAVAVVSVAVLLGLWIFGFVGGPPIPPAPSAGQAQPKTVPPSVAISPPAESAFKENESAPITAHDWPRFRGPDGNGLVKAGDWPRKWDAATGDHIVWKTPVPMPGNSSPVLWGDRLFLTGANAHQQEAFCFSRASGKLLWQTPIFAARGNVKPEDIKPLPVTGYASPTPATDGARLYVTYASADIAAVDYDGRVIWARNLGKPENAEDSSYGRATSLLLYKDKVIVQFDRGMEPTDGLSALLALDAKTGKTVWGTPRPVRRCWCTPILIAVAGRAELVANGSPWIIAYDPENGKELWRCAGMKEDVAASPTFADGLVYVTNDHAKVFAIRPAPNEQGDVTATNIVWTAEEGLSDAPSPVCDGRFFLQANSSGLLTCYDAKSGKLFWKEVLNGAVWASPTLAGGWACVPSEDGNVYLFPLADQFGPVTACKLGEPLLSTPAFADGCIYFRGEKTLFCVGAAERKP